MNKDENFIFKEVQRFKTGVLWMFLIPLSGVFWWGVIQQVILKIPFGNKPGSDEGLVANFVIFGIGLPLLFYFSNLVTEVRKDGIYFKFTPFQTRFRKILFSEIKHFEIRKYSPLKDYGGWGIRYGSKGRAYNVSGNMGIQFELNNGKRILIGTQEAAKFKEVIDKVIAERT